MLILHKPRQMVAGEEYTIQCEVTGSRPKATVTWTRDNRIFRRGEVRPHVILLGLMDAGSLRRKSVERTNKTNSKPSVACKQRILEATSEITKSIKDFMKLK